MSHYLMASNNISSTVVWHYISIVTGSNLNWELLIIFTVKVRKDNAYDLYKYEIVVIVRVKMPINNHSFIFKAIKANSCIPISDSKRT